MDIKCLVVFQNYFYFFYPFFKPLKTSLKFRFTPALRKCISSENLFPVNFYFKDHRVVKMTIISCFFLSTDLSSSTAAFAKSTAMLSKETFQI